jgi:hypothetical protein
MNKVDNLAEGDIMQLSPEKGVCKNPMFAGCMFVVTEPKKWGAQGYVQGLGEFGNSAGQAYYRANWEEMEYTGGRAIWIAK